MKGADFVKALMGGVGDDDDHPGKHASAFGWLLFSPWAGPGCLGCDLGFVHLRAYITERGVYHFQLA